MTTTPKKFYIPHKPEVKLSAKTTKLQIEYDALAKPTKTNSSLIEYLVVGLALQNMLWNVLTWCHLESVAITGELK